HFTPEKKSAKHSQIKFKRLRLLKLQPSKVWMIRAQEHIPFAADGSGGNVQSSEVCVANPPVAKHQQRFISQLIPVGREGFHIHAFDFEIVRDLGLNRNQIVGSKFRFQVDECLHG